MLESEWILLIVCCMCAVIPLVVLLAVLAFGALVDLADSLFERRKR